MATIAAIHSRLTLNTKDFRTGLDKAAAKTAAFVGGVGSMTAKLGGLAARATFAGAAILGIGSAVGTLIVGTQLAAQAEQAEVAFGTMLGSADAAKKMVGDLSDFAASTPFDMPGLTDAAKKLVAFGSSPEQVIPELKAIGDIAAGVGVPIGDLAEIYGKARTSGVLMAEDINQLTGRGIPIIGALAKQFGVADSEIKKMVSEGKVGFPQLQQAFKSLTGEGGQFNGMMDAQSRTLGGLWSTLQDGAGMLTKSLVEGLFAKLDIKGLMSDVIAVLPIVQAIATATMELATSVLGDLIGNISAAGAAGESSGNRILAGMEYAVKGAAWLLDMVDGARFAYDYLRIGANTFFAAAARGIANLADMAANLPDWLGGGVAADVAGIAEMFAANLDQEVAKLQTAINEKLIAPSNAERVTAFFAKVKTDAEAAAAAAASVQPAELTIDTVAAKPDPDFEKITGVMADLQKQIDRFGMSEIEIKLADLADLNVGVDVLAQAEQRLTQLDAMAKQKERTEDFAQTMADLQKQIDTQGLDERALFRFDLESAGHAQGEIEKAMAKYDELERRRKEISGGGSADNRLVTAGSAEAQRLAFAAARDQRAGKDDTPKRQLDVQTKMASSLDSIFGVLSTKPNSTSWEL